MSERPCILLVEDDALIGQLFQELLAGEGMDLHWVLSAEDGLAVLDQREFDLIVTDKNLPGKSGLDLLAAARAKSDATEVIVITAYADVQSILQAMHQGAYDFIPKPFDSLDEVLLKMRRALEKRRMLLENRRLVVGLQKANAEIAAMNESLEQKVLDRTEELRHVNARLEALTLSDDVTGLFNQRFLYQRLEEEFRRQRRHQQGLAILMVDIDDFKTVNDEHDHLFGSRVLRRVGEQLKRSVRNVDLCVRYGGDEFTVILPHTDQPNALRVAERIRQTIAAADLGDEGEAYHVTVSVGLAVYGNCTADSPRSFLRAADLALYAAKANGRNRVAVMNGANAVVAAG